VESTWSRRFGLKRAASILGTLRLAPPAKDSGYLLDTRALESHHFRGIGGCPPYVAYGVNGAGPVLPRAREHGGADQRRAIARWIFTARWLVSQQGLRLLAPVYTACVHIRRRNIPSGLTATTRLMRFLLAVALTLAVCSTQPAQAEPPKPQPHPSAKGKRITWVSYVWEREGPNWTFRCYVPTSGKQQCQLIVLG